MKLTFSKFIFLCILVSGLAACGDDPVTNTDPSLTTTTAERDTIKAIANQSAAIKISGIKGSAELNTLEVLENEKPVVAARISFKGSGIGKNPIVLLTNDREGFNAEIKLRTLYADTVTKITLILTATDGKSSKIERLVKATKTSPIVSYGESNPVNAIAPGADHPFRFSVSAGSAPVTRLLVKENGIIITDVSRLKFDTLNFFSNPFVFPEAQNAFTSKKVIVRAPATPGKWEYSFTFIDSLGGSSTKDVTAYVGTRLDVNRTGILANAADAGAGGLDLDTGTSVSSTSDDAEIKDQGIDTSLPVASNWKQKISPAGSAEMRWVVQVIDINNIYVKEQILTYWNLGTPIPNGTPSKVLLGDTYVVKKDDRYYFLQVSKVSPTSADNADKFEIGIKW